MLTWKDAIFAPDSVALVGASSGEGKMGRVFMQNLQDGYTGKILPIHPKDKNILGCEAYPNLKELPDKPDLALVITPPHAVAGVIEDCAEVGIKAVVIITSGFAETGDEGRKVQDRIADTAMGAGIRIAGPNCFGVINVHKKFNGSLGLALPSAGGISLFTQSGAYGMLTLPRFDKRGAGFAKIFAPGNKIDLDEVDLISYFAEDPDTRVIAMLLESVVDLEDFAEAARKAAAKKPVIILKNGRGVAGKRAARHHTDSVADDGALMEILSGSGVHFPTDGGTLFEMAATLSYCTPKKASRISIITNSGGTGVELTDLFEDRGFSVPLLSQDLQAKLQAEIPAYGSTNNPVDMTPDAPRYPDMYAGILRHLLVCDEVDIIVVVLLQRSAMDSEITQRIISEVEKARSDKIIHVCTDESPGAEDNRQKLENAGIPCHSWTRATAEAINLCHNL